MAIQSSPVLKVTPSHRTLRLESGSNPSLLGPMLTTLDGDSGFRQCRQVVLVTLPRGLRSGESGVELRGQTWHHLAEVAVIRIGIHAGGRSGVGASVLARDALVGPPTGAAVAAAGKGGHPLAIQYGGGAFAGQG